MSKKPVAVGLVAILLAMTGAVAVSAQANSNSPPLASDTFIDVQRGHWADEAIGWAIDNGITTGTSATTFSPNDTLTRAQMVTFLHRYDHNVINAPRTGVEDLVDPVVDPVTLSGSGQDVTGAVVLTDGRWRVTVEVENNIDRTFGSNRGTNVIVRALGEDNDQESLVNEITAAGRWTKALAIGDGFLALPNGKVWFEVEGVAQDATWTITIEPL